MAAPELSVRNSGYGGRGYAIPALQGEEGKLVTTAGGKLNARLDDGRPLIVPSVTTILKASASPGLTQWAVDQTAAYAAANAEKLLSRSPEAAYGYLRWYYSRAPNPLEEEIDLRNYHTGVLQDAADLGTLIHEWTQADTVPELDYPDISNANTQFFEMVGAWDAWAADKIIEPVLTEATVYNTHFGYAGTLDCLWRINGKLCLIDIKSARSLWPDHSRQLAALSQADTLLRKDADGHWVHEDWQTYMEDVEYIGFLHIRPSDVDTKGNTIAPFVEQVEATNLDVHFRAFQACLRLKDCDIEVARRESEAQ